MKRIGDRIARVSLALVWLVAMGCAKPQSPPPETAVAERETYVIQPSDVLGVSVWKNPELSLEQVPVRPDGKITVPLAGDVQAAGLTTDQVKERIQDGLKEYITAPDVTVIALQLNSQRVSVVGEVNRPGPVPLGVDTRVLDAITAAGGFTAFANKDAVRILRRQPDGSVVEYGFDYDDFIAGKAQGSNFLLQAGDTVAVPD